MLIQFKSMKPYFFSILLLSSILLGGFAGYLGGEKVQFLKPFGEIFLHLIFTAIVPLIFFSVSSAIARAGSLKKLGRIFFYMMVMFILTSSVASILSMMVIHLFPVGQDVHLPLMMQEKMPTTIFSSHLADIITVPDFSKLLSHEHILALIVFSMLVGLAVPFTNEHGKRFASFLQSGEVIFMRVFSLIMYFAPIGFFSYFAIIVSELGPQIMANYLQVAEIYYLFSIGYFFIVFRLYSYLSGRWDGIKLFWKNIFLPAVTSLATCSSAASIPANLYAANKMKVPPEIYEMVIPLGAIIHKDGSVIGGIIKIAFLFSVFHMDFSGMSVLLVAFGVSLLVGTVMGAIPSGGMLGELLILSIYGFPSTALIAVAAISIIIDPIATLLNVTGNSVCGMLIARVIEGRDWFRKPVLQ